MALFQKSVIKKYLKELNPEKVQESWQLFKVHFQNPTIQQHIRDSKEEEYQEGFVRDLFVTVLGYILKPQPNFNFVLEQKSTTDATKSDGAIWNDGTVSTVIELKDTYTTELDKVEKQAFGYKHQHKDCIYIITSNFEKLRFYINDATDHIEFNLFILTETEFQLLYLCLHSNQLLNNVPLRMKQASVTEEENITKKLYSDYSKFKQELFTNIAAHNTQYNKLDLFKKTQKLLDRLLFILFAEDRLLVPPNSVRVILADWEKLKELDNYVPLYERFKKYFGYLNIGHEGKQYEIYAYNGGLFAPDEILDSIKMDDALLYNGCRALSDYDFESEVDVNILGHIFEHSLSEIEEVQAQLAGTAVEKTKTKRKKDGVFYTPRYITKYIVENTLGVLCEEKKKELAISKEVFEYRKRKDQKREKLVGILDAYRNWLFQLTICDPACGSGAFLNQALEFLITEHSYVDELKAKLFGDLMVLTDVETTILENNLFGVDINEEAVEIARLSLWLRTARKGRKLNNLSENIKCGNSLIDDPAVAGDKAFNWQKEFPQIFGAYIEVDISGKQKTTTADELKQKHAAAEPRTYTIQEEAEAAEYNTEQITNDDNAVVNTDFKIVNEPEAEYNIKKQVKRGFDVVIGNPPYGAKFNSREIEFFRKNYGVVVGHSEAYYLFTEKSYAIIKDRSYLGLIIPNAWLSNKYAKGLRNFILKKFQINLLVNFNQKIIFDEADVETAIIILQKTLNIKKLCLVGSDIGNEFEYEYSSWFTNDNNVISFSSDTTINTIFSKMLSSDSKLEDKLDVSNGIKPYQAGYGFNLSGQPLTRDDVDNKIYHSKYQIDDSYKKEIKGKGVNRYSFIWEESYVKWGNWLMSPKALKYHESPKILIRQIISSHFLTTIDFDKFYADQSLYICINYENDTNNNLFFYLSLLNSRLYGFFFRKFYSEEDELFPKIKVNELKALPVKSLPIEKQLLFVEQSTIMLSKNRELQHAKKQLQQLLLSKYEGLILSKKLEDWPSLSFKDFLKELSKQKIKLTLSEESEWLNYFEEQKAKANAIKQVIDVTDKEIDKMVYQLYELTPEEIKMVEGQ